MMMTPRERPPLDTPGPTLPGMVGNTETTSSWTPGAAPVSTAGTRPQCGSSRASELHALQELDSGRKGEASVGAQNKSQPQVKADATPRECVHTHVCWGVGRLQVG